ncbi:MAG: UTP--glucose-1-phosphate uridylyltransferase GalU [bacterium]
MKVTKAIIPAAGLGTRFLPASKITPKELLPVFDKPAIQYVVEEGVKSGIKNFIIISSRNKKTIEDHFDFFPELEEKLKKQGKENLISTLSGIIKNTSFTYVRQNEPLGLGHAIWAARHNVGKEHVAIFLPDDIIDNPIPGMAQLIKVATQEKCNVIAVQEIPKEQVSKYGIIDIRKQFSPNLFQVKELVEKPDPTKAPSNLAIVGRYVLSSNIFEALDDLKIGANNEIQLTDGIQNLILSGEKVFAYRMQGTRYDVGNPLGLLKASINFGLKHPEYSDLVVKHLSELDKELLLLQGRMEIIKKQRIANL